MTKKAHIQLIKEVLFTLPFSYAIYMYGVTLVHFGHLLTFKLFKFHLEFKKGKGPLN